MATMNYKCPNCDGPLMFNPDKQMFCCEYCLGEFTPAQVQQINAAISASYYSYNSAWYWKRHHRNGRHK